MKHLFTVFTPTHNRAHLIHTLYESLKRQTFKDFVWLVVDDGSHDNTKEVIENFQKENILDIKYHFIPNGFLYLAEKYSASVIDSEYIIRVDDDDELTDNCLEIFKCEFGKIEKEGITDIGEIRALSILDDGTIAGNYQPTLNQAPIDTTYIERHLNTTTQLENIECRKVEIWKQLFSEDDHKKWLFEKINHISDSLFWCRLSKLCRTRYIFIALRKYHNTQVSLTHNLPKRTKQNVYNTVFSRYMYLNEMQDYYIKYPRHFFKILCSYAIFGFALRLNFFDMLYAIENTMCKVFFVVISPLCWLYSFKYKI